MEAERGRQSPPGNRKMLDRHEKMAFCSGLVCAILFYAFYLKQKNGGTGRWMGMLKNMQETLEFAFEVPNEVYYNYGLPPILFQIRYNRLYTPYNMVRKTEIAFS